MAGKKVDLAKSDIERKRMLDRFGFIPLSVLREIKYGSLSRRMLTYQAETPATQNSTTEWTKEKIARPEFQAQLKQRGKKFSVIPPFGEDRAALSIMPAELVDFFVKFYAEPGEVYLDPFAAQGIQMQVAALRGMHYLGQDLCHEFATYMQSILPIVKSRALPQQMIRVFEGDSRFPDPAIKDESGDFSFHSPPYWDIEHYGDEPEQLGTGKSYEEFLKGMQDVAAAWLPKFKSTAFHVVNVGDFLRDSRIVNYHGDTIDIFKAAGWRYHDLWVLDQVVAGSNRIFAVSTSNKKRAPRVHEYALVFKPPKD